MPIFLKCFVDRFFIDALCVQAHVLRPSVGRESSKNAWPVERVVARCDESDDDIDIDIDDGARVES